MSFEKHLHIICSEMRLPVDYGASFDLLYKIKSLHKAGILLHLHCFDPANQHEQELNRYAIEVNYYTNRDGHKGFSFRLPYIVGSRIDPRLAESLLLDDHPILIEGIHCSYLVHDPRFSMRKIIIRGHRLESDSYREMKENSWHLLKRFYYGHESRLLRAYEEQTFRLVPVCCVSDRMIDCVSSFYFGQHKPLHPFPNASFKWPVQQFRDTGKILMSVEYQRHIPPTRNEKIRRQGVKIV